MAVITLQEAETQLSHWLNYSKIPLNLYYSLWSAIRIIAPGGA